MSPANHYKKFERKLLYAVGKTFLAVYLFLRIHVFVKLVNLVRHRFTVLIVPFSEKKVFSLRISMHAIIFISILCAGMGAFLLYYSLSISEIQVSYLENTKAQADARLDLQKLHDGIQDLKDNSRVFEGSVNGMLSTLGLSHQDNIRSTEDGFLSEYFGRSSAAEDVLAGDLSDLRSLTLLLDDSSKSLDSISGLLSSQGMLLYDLPSIWPIEGGIGRITTPFGPTEDCFTGQTYLHKGIDIGYGYDAPIIATANGKVVSRRYEPLNYGNVVMVRHNFGFYTVYGHMNKVFVHEGDTVVQGQRIGLMGSTGKSSGPHLHYEVRLGPQQVIDPSRFLKIK